MAVVESDNLTKSFGNLRALDGVSFSVEKGEFYGLLGPNGAGKTTLTRIMTGQLAPDTGSARVLGVSCLDSIAVKRQVGIVPEADTPPTFLTAQEFLELVCRIRKTGNIEARVGKWLRFFRITDRADVLCRDLSKGQRQKVMLAAAFITDPKLLLLDEPFINLDPIYQKKVRKYLQDVVGRGRTVFMCTHILDMAERLCSRVAVINHGKIVAKGTIDEIRSKKGERLEDVFMRLVEDE